MRENRLGKHYDLIARHDSIMQLPLINAAETPETSHVVLNKGPGQKAVVDKKQILSAMLVMELISGQRPRITEAKKSIDKYKLRQGMFLGCKVTLRKNKAYLFPDRLMTHILPKAGAMNPIMGARPASGLQGRSVAYGIQDLYVYDEVLRLGGVDERLGGFDIVFVYHGRHFFDH